MHKYRSLLTDLLTSENMPQTKVNIAFEVNRLIDIGTEKQIEHALDHLVDRYLRRTDIEEELITLYKEYQERNYLNAVEWRELVENLHDIELNSQ